MVLGLTARNRSEEMNGQGKKITDLRRFCQDMNDRDFVVLRLGTNSIYGVGQIVGDYEHCEEFNDIDGWAIAHVRRIRLALEV